MPAARAAYLALTERHNVGSAQYWRGGSVDLNRDDGGAARKDINFSETQAVIAPFGFLEEVICGLAQALGRIRLGSAGPRVKQRGCQALGPQVQAQPLRVRTRRRRFRRAGFHGRGVLGHRRFNPLLASF